MKSRNPLRVRSVALAIACGVVAFGTQPVRGAAAQVPQTTTSVAKAAARVDGGWPRGYTAPSGAKIVLYQPQVSDWIDQKRLTAYAAVSYLKTGAAKPDLGVIQIQADSTVSVEERLVNFSKLAITESNFQTLSKTENQEIVSEIMKAYPEGDRVIALDRVLASIERSSLKVKDADNLKADPPRVYFSELPAILVGVDGEPVWSPIKDNDLKYAVNTNWDLFQFGTAKQLYLRNGDTWLKSLSLVGPWTPAGKLPDAFNTLPADDDWKDVKANLPGKTVTSAPVVYATTQPAELILLAGAPKYIHVEGTGLEWVSNTDSDVFRMGTTGTIYYLVSGRWFSAPNFSGPWTFATPNLPEDFKNIPRSHTRSYVRASVPGTDEAIDAVLLANVPTTARVNKKELQAPEVAYSGNPEYKAVEGTTVQRAVNTDKDIIKVGDVYYMCFEGVWFMATGPNGPWSV
ncbi:MAG TPA: hypothetical protein PLF26_10985, partial [Blastocatellia bacterium]|nr:hypothetical protein [Blastocatellia bacterium]